MIAGVETVIKERGALGKVSAPAVLFDASTKAALEFGAAVGVYVQRLCDVGALAVDKFVDLAAGKAVPMDVPVDARSKGPDLRHQWCCGEAWTHGRLPPGGGTEPEESGRAGSRRRDCGRVRSAGARVASLRGH